MSVRTVPLDDQYVSAHPSRSLCRRCVGRFLRAVLSQVLLGLCWWNLARSRRTSVRTLTFFLPHGLPGYLRHHVHLLLLLPAYFRAPASAAPFIAIIVKVPVVQIASMILGMLMLVVEYPLPQIKEFAIYRSLAMRVVFLLIQVVLNILYYQVSTRFRGITTFPARIAHSMTHTRGQTPQSGL